MLAALLAAALQLSSLAIQAGPAGTALTPEGGPGETREVVAEVRVHGNVLTPDEEVLRLSGLVAGSPFGPETLAAAESRLRAAKRFEHVEVLKRFASIADASQILVVIVVDEGPVRIEKTGDADRPVRVAKVRSRLMFLPVLGVEDGYGVTYGVRFTAPGVLGTRSRVSFPLTWGGDKRAAVEVSKDLDRGPLTRVEAEASLNRRTNPFYDADDGRRRVSARAERRLTPWLRAGAGGGWGDVNFQDTRDRVADAGADIVVDTRRDPVLARNAVYVRAAWDHLMLPDTGVNRASLLARGFVGVVGQTVAIATLQHESANGPLPPYLQPLLGGMENLRGFRTGFAAGDNLVAASLELRVPLTSPLRFGRAGVSAFVDRGVVYASGEHWTDREMKTGAGGTVWFSAAFLRMSLALAHGVGASTRVHVGMTLSY